MIDDDIARLYENWFIETCEPWVVPYIGDLIGYEPRIAGHILGRRLAPRSANASSRIAVPRSDVAHTIRDRRRKGTLALLEDLARDAAGWPARAVSSYRLLASPSRSTISDSTRPDRRSASRSRARPPRQRLRRPRPHRRRRQAHLESPAGALQHPECRVCSSGGSAVRHHAAPAFCIDRARNHYTFSVLGNDAPLITKPVAEPTPTHIR